MRPVTSLLFVACLFAMPFRADASQPPRPLAPGEIRLRLEKLRVVGSVLYVAAHPDDENTSVLAHLANGRLLRTGYLSLTRGDGGQNLIGAEQGVALGVIRTQELLAARRIDGAEQLFTRARDFGFSKSAEETLRIWGKQETLTDVVWAVRRFRPDVIITRFSPKSGGDGQHGHHTASAQLAVEAFRAAADPAFAPEQLKDMAPWQAKRILWNRSSFGASTPAPEGAATVDVGGFSPLLGQSFGEIAAASRSMHKSQGFGSAARRGPIVETFELLAGEPGGAKAGDPLFAGVDLTWRRFPGTARIDEALARAVAAFRVDAPEAALPALLEADAELSALPSQHPATPWREAKLRELRELVLACAGLWVEATASAPITVPGGEVKVTASAVNRWKATVSWRSLRIGGRDGTTVNKDLPRGQLVPLEESVRIPEDARLTTPWWTQGPPGDGSRRDGEGRFGGGDVGLVGQPESPPALEASFVLAITAGGKGRELTVTRPVLYKWTDPVAGERHRPLEVLPPVTVAPAASVLMFADARPQSLRLVLRAQTKEASGTLHLQAPEGFAVSPSNLPFAFKGEPEREATIEVRRAGKNTQASGQLRILLGPGGPPARGAVHLTHPHIPHQVLLSEATVKLVPVSLRRGGDRIAYVAGAGDEVATSLRRVGYRVSALDESGLATADLSAFDAIVFGVRAFNVNERLGVHHSRLMRYVEEGGTVLVQYNTQNRISGVSSALGPYPFEISRERVTDERAAVTMKDHPVLRGPNRITADDFVAWVQERGLYFAGKWDPKYEAPLSMNDPGEPPRGGSLLVAKHGRGRFVYTGLAFFRQLPAGVPGAYRLFANLLARDK